MGAIVYRKGELSKGTIDRQWPHQVALPASRCCGHNYVTIRLFCEDLSLCPRGHAFRRNDEDMSAYIKAADAIRETFNCSVLIVHHCGVNDSRPRGHTSLTGAADAQLAIKRDYADNVVVTVEFMKDGESGDTIVSKLDPVEIGLDEDGDPIRSCVLVEAEAPVKEAGQPNSSPTNRPTSTSYLPLA